MAISPFKKATGANKEGSRNPEGRPSESGQLKARVPELDGIRGVAILMVVCVHYFRISQDSGGWFTKVGATVVSFAWSGVDLFFVLSGFLIGGILIDNRNATNYFRTFYTRRICRIFPLYFLWLMLYYLLPSLLRPGFPGYSACFIWQIFHFPKWGYVFFTQNFYMSATSDLGPLWMAATWSLAVEEQFYLLLPALIRFALPCKPLPVLIILIALVPALRIFLFLFHPSLSLFVLFPCRADSLLLGVLCAYLLRQKRSYAWLARNRKSLYALFFCLLIGMVYLVSLGYKQSIVKVLDSFEMTSFGFTLIGLFFACFLLIAMIDKTGVIARLLRTRFLRHFGIIAYGIYLTHIAIRVIISEFILRPAPETSSIFSQDLAAVPAFLVTWLLAVLSWRFFEQPIVRWGHSFRYAPQKVSGMQPGVVSTETTSLP